MFIKQQILSKAAKLKNPVSGVFELTPRCNFNCRMCFIKMNDEQVRSLGGELSIGDWMRVCDEAYDNGMLYLLFTGGEVFLIKEFPQLYRHAYEKGIILSINSNGSLITDEHIQMLTEMPPEKINITLYGDSQDMYSDLCGNMTAYKTVIDNILKLKENGIRVAVNCTLTKLNVSCLDNLISFATENGLTLNIATYMFPPMRNGCSEYDSIRLSAEECGRIRAYLDFRDESLREKKAKAIAEGANISRLTVECPESGTKCMAGRSSFWMTWQGKMSACGMLTDFVDYKIGGFQDAWTQLVQRTSKITYPTECDDCKYGGLCTSCAAINFAEGGAYDKVPQFFCDMTKAYIDEFNRLYNE